MVQSRVQALRAWMSEQRIDAYFITNAHNRKYVSGFTGSAGYVLMTLQHAYLLTDFRYREQAPQQAPDFEIIEHASQVGHTVRELLTQLNIHQLAFEQADVTYQQYGEYAKQIAPIELIPSASIGNQLRMKKDQEEIKIMQEAAQLADATFEYVLPKLKPGVSEQEIALEIEFYIRRHGGSSTSFETIVASGERSALPHGIASERKFARQEFIKLDFGAYYQGYCSDLTRTVMLGKPTDKHYDVYQIVLEAQQHTLSLLKPGMTGKEADALARDVITRHGYGDYFGHGTGHGLGMEIHEFPRLNKQDTTILQPGMVVTVEPGIYLPGFGGVRIEDDVLITQTGIQRLTHTSKDFLIID